MQKFEIQNPKARQARIVSNAPPTHFVQHLVASKYKSFAPYTTIKNQLVNIKYVTFTNVIEYTINQYTLLKNENFNYDTF